MKTCSGRRRLQSPASPASSDQRTRAAVAACGPQRGMRKEGIPLTMVASDMGMVPRYSGRSGWPISSFESAHDVSRSLRGGGGGGGKKSRR